MKKIKIFLASSEELKEERKELGDFVGHLNHAFERIGVTVQLEKWEYIDSSMGEQHKQEDYNDKLRECEMCIVIYWTKFGLYTKAELDVAYNELKAGNNPRKLYVYFKEIEDGEAITPELKAFRDSFPTEYGHFENCFRNIDTLKTQFLLQFIEYQGKSLSESSLIEVRDGKVSVGGKTYVDLTNVPFVGNNEDYNELLEDIEDLREWLDEHEPGHKKYAEKAEKLREKVEKKEKMESSLWNTALDITRLSNAKCSERLQRAIDLFNQGDNRGANAILNEEEICRDAEHNKKLIRLGEEGREGLKINIEELKLKIQTLENEMGEGWREKIVDLHNKVMEYTKEAFGENSEKYINALLNAGNIFRTLGRYSEALTLEESALKLSLSLFGEKHLKTATSYNNVGLTYSNLGNHDKALEYELKALEIDKELLGERHPSTATSYNNIGCTYGNLGDHEKELEFLLTALDICNEILGEKHPSTATSYNNVGNIYKEFRNHKIALEFLSKALDIRKEVCGEKHLDTASSYESMGSFYVRYYYLYADMEEGLDMQSRYKKMQEGLDFHLKALDIRKEILGEIHPATARSYENVGAAYEKLCIYKKALEYNLKALDINKEILGEKHLDIAKSYDYVISDIYDRLNNYEKKLECQLIALEIYKEKQEELGPKHIAHSYKDVRYTYEKLGNHEKALEYQLKALDIYKEIYGERHSYTADYYNAVGYIYDELGNYEKALEYQLIVLLIVLDIRGETKPLDLFDIFIAYDNVISTYEKLNNYEKALEYTSKAYETLKDTDYQKEYPKRLGIIYDKMGDKENAKAKFMEALALLPEDHSDVIDIRKRLEEL